MKKEKKKNKKLPLFFRIFDPKEILYDFIKWTGGWPFLFFYRVKGYITRQKEKVYLRDLTLYLLTIFLLQTFLESEQFSGFEELVM